MFDGDFVYFDCVGFLVVVVVDGIYLDVDW